MQNESTLNVHNAPHLKRTTLDDVMYHMLMPFIPANAEIVLPLRVQRVPHNMARQCILAMMQINCVENLSTAERDAVCVMLDALPNKD